MKEPSNYRTRKVYVSDLKTGQRFYDGKDKRYYEISEVAVDERTVKVLIKTNPTNTRKDGVIKKSPYGKVTVREFKE